MNTQNKWMVSVLVTFYNQKDYVNRALESVFEQQTNFGFEVLVGDDGSTDGTLDVVREWMDKYPEQIYLYPVKHTEGKSVPGFRASKNRINLLEHVHGEYFIFLDGDDYFSNPCKLQRQVDILQKQEFQNCIACGHSIEALYSDGTSELFLDPGLPEGVIKAADYWKQYYLHTDTLLIRSNVVEKLPLKLLDHNFNDNMITFSVIQHGDIYFIPEAMAVYAQTMGGIWTGEKKVVSLVRNMYMVDISEQIGAKMRKQSRMRMAGDWFRMLGVRKEIGKHDLKIYENEAKEKGFRYTLQWLHYQELDALSRMKLVMLAMFRCRYLIKSGWIKKMYRHLRNK